MADRMAQIKHKVLVLSGKGGVGKSTVACNMAVTLATQGLRVGLLDVDLCGPSVPLLLGLNKEDVVQCSEGWVPVSPAGLPNLKVMSLQFLLPDKDAAVVWRGPKKNALIRQFLTDVYWQELDYLIVDTPPGTSDEHMAVVEQLLEHEPEGAVIVTTPQNVSLADVRREIGFCRQTGVPIIGLVENMSGFVCPHCKDCTNIFSSGGGRSLAEHTGVDLLGTIPLDPSIGQAAEEGKGLVQSFPESGTYASLLAIIQRVRGVVEGNSNTDQLTAESDE